MLTQSTEILIVGAGPAGMALSIALLQAGVDHVIVDRLAQGQNTSRAGVIHAQTLESLQGLGVTERMVALGLKLDRFTIRDRDRALLGLSFGALPTVHPYLLMLPQNVTEAVLEERIVELGGRVERGVEARAIAQDGQGAQAVLAGADGERLVTARHVVGADGMHSVVRETVGIGFDGGAHEGSFMLADVRLDWPYRQEEVSLFFSDAGMLVVAPLPDGSFRVVAAMDEAPEKPAACDVQALLDARGPQESVARVTGLIWSSRFRIHHRIASAYRHGRLFLIGDAAHVHSPAGGQGMNTGLIDAVVLGEILSGVVAGARPAADLDLYEALRRPAAGKVIAMASMLTGMATMRSPVKRALRNAALSLLDLNPMARRRIAMNLSGLSRAEMAKVPPAAIALAA